MFGGVLYKLSILETFTVLYKLSILETFTVLYKPSILEAFTVLYKLSILETFTVLYKPSILEAFTVFRQLVSCLRVRGQEYILMHIYLYNKSAHDFNHDRISRSYSTVESV